MGIYVLVCLSFACFCWIVAILQADSASEALFLLAILGAYILGVVFQAMSLAA